MEEIKWGESSKRKSWDEAVKWCEEQGGRLSTSVELHQAFLDQIKGFPDDYCWSSTLYPTDKSFAYLVDMRTGAVYSTYKIFAVYARCILNK